MSVHDRFGQSDMTEATPVPTAAAADLAPYHARRFAEWADVVMNPESYGPLKRACELAAIAALGGTGDPVCAPGCWLALVTGATG